MEEKPFKRIANALKKAVEGSGVKDLGPRALRAAAQGAKGALEKTREEMSRDVLSRAVGEILGVIGGPDLAHGISSAIGSLDETAVKGVIDRVAARLQDDDVAHRVAWGLRKALDYGGTADGISRLVEAGLKNMAGPEYQGVIGVAMGWIEAGLKAVEDLDEKQTKQTLQRIAHVIPSVSHILAAQASILTEQFTPERIADLQERLLSKLPSAEATGDIVRAAAEAAIKQMDRAADPAKADAPPSMADFRADAAQMMKEILEKDKRARAQQAYKSGGKFKLDGR